MSYDTENAHTMDIYHILDDGRIVELIIGKSLDTGDAIWARNLTAEEKETYLKLKSLGHSDMNIYQCLNQMNNKAIRSAG